MTEASNVYRHPALRSYGGGEAGDDGGGGGGNDGGGDGGGGGSTEESDPWQSCPFEILGASRGPKYWFLDRTGVEVEFSPHTLAQWSSLLHLCGGDRWWLAQNFPSLDRDGQPTGWFNNKFAVSAIMARATAVPPFDTEIPRRFHGLWPISGGVALHLGDRVLWRGEERRAGFIEDGALFARLSPRKGPGEPASMAVGRELEAVLNSWNWRDPHGGEIMLGIIVAGWLAGVLEWRPHAFVVGEAGTGKTTLLRDLVAKLCPLTRYLNDFTVAGIRQLLRNTAASIVLDEAEGDRGDDSKLRHVLEMLRKASSGEGVQSVRGGADQEASQGRMAGAAIMGATLPPPFEPPDLTRFAVLILDPLAAEGGGPDIGRFVAEHGPELWGRAIENAERCLALVALLRARLVARGVDPRQADQLGTIAACRWIMIEEWEADPRSADTEDDPDMVLACVEHLIVAKADRLADANGTLALERLLSSALDMAGDRITIGQALNEYRAHGRRIVATANDDQMMADREKRSERMAKLGQMLTGHGLRWNLAQIVEEEGAAPIPRFGLYVTVGDHPRLARAFADTAWSGKRWGPALAQLPGVLSGKACTPQRIAGVVMRCVWVPWHHFAEPSDEA